MIHPYLLPPKFTLTPFMDLNYISRILLQTLTIISVTSQTVTHVIDANVICWNDISITLITLELFNLFSYAIYNVCCCKGISLCYLIIILSLSVVLLQELLKYNSFRLYIYIYFLRYHVRSCIHFSVVIVLLHIILL